MMDSSRRRTAAHTAPPRDVEDHLRARVWLRVRQGILEERRHHRRKAWLAGVSGALGGISVALLVIDLGRFFS